MRQPYPPVFSTLYRVWCCSTEPAYEDCLKVIKCLLKWVKSNGRGYGFTRNGEAYENFLRRNGINHEIYLGRDRNWSGFVERYKKSFFKRYSRWLDLDSGELSRTEAIQSIKNDTLHATTPIAGYPNFGLSPSNLIEEYKTPSLII